MLLIQRRAGLASSNYISSEPEIQKHKVEWEDEFIIIASDGLWELMSNQEAVDFVSGFLYTQRQKKLDIGIPSKPTEPKEVSQTKARGEEFYMSVKDQKERGLLEAIYEMFSWIRVGSQQGGDSSKSEGNISSILDFNDEDDNMVIHQHKIPGKEAETMGSHKMENPAHALVLESIRRLEMKNRMNQGSISQLPSKIRRQFHDDISVIIVPLFHKSSRRSTE
eukprot:TRINITY_DN18979_c0_g1_i1.p1 TRINITY_DN18979_c0_g1~~TRINITY_DN18979_c0_g1_i1.p1  ORF type:complete len:222 (+),score=33.77 TRINITY_DN18979_c0_g1_i1:209-874(+)